MKSSQCYILSCCIHLFAGIRFCSGRVWNLEEFLESGINLLCFKRCIAPAFVRAKNKFRVLCLLCCCLLHICDVDRDPFCWYTMHGWHFFTGFSMGCHNTWEGKCQILDTNLKQVPFHWSGILITFCDPLFKLQSLLFLFTRVSDFRQWDLCRDTTSEGRTSTWHSTGMSCPRLARCLLTK